MSDNESFLARWSRRKRGAAPKTPEQPQRGIAGGCAALEDSTPSTPSGGTPPPFDPASLPAVESIGAGSDIRAFLATGVPADLTRAALRRAWSSEPIIRDFVGLSENSWDFNAPGGVPGFGSVKADDIRQLLAQAVGEPAAASDPYAAAEKSSATQATSCPSVPGPAVESIRHELVPFDSAQVELGTDHGTRADHDGPVHRDEGKPAALVEPEVRISPVPRRGRGGALPE